MNCVEFRQALPGTIDNVQQLEDHPHLRNCYQCSSLVADLDSISRAAKDLQATEEPSPRVWNSLEIQLRREGLIRRQVGPVRPPRPFSLWTNRWLLPAAAAMLLVFGLTEIQNRGSRAPSDTIRPAAQIAQGFPAEFPDDEQQILEQVASRQPGERAQYAVNLRTVDTYIRDAEQSVRNDPNDVEAQRDLMNAYQQRAMVYRMALDRSLQ